MHCPNTGDVFCLSGRAEDIWSPRWAVGIGFVPVGSPQLQFLFINSLLVNSWKTVRPVSGVYIVVVVGKGWGVTSFYNVKSETITIYCGFLQH